MLSWWAKNTKRSTIELSTMVEWRDISELGKYDSCCKLRVLDLVETRKPCLSELDYIQLATADLEGARPSANTDLPSIHGAPPCEHNVWGDGWTLGLVQCRATHANVDRAAAASVPLEPYNSHIADGYEVGVLFDTPHSASRFVGKRCTQPLGNAIAVSQSCRRNTNRLHKAILTHRKGRDPKWTAWPPCTLTQGLKLSSSGLCRAMQRL